MELRQEQLLQLEQLKLELTVELQVEQVAIRLRQLVLEPVVGQEQAAEAELGLAEEQRQGLVEQLVTQYHLLQTTARGLE